MKHPRASLPTTTSTDSFWHSEPNEFLRGHRTTEKLPAEADIVIVGTGISGTSAARYLTEDDRANGKSIVVLDAREACWCATGRVSSLRPIHEHSTAYSCILEHGASTLFQCNTPSYSKRRTKQSTDWTIERRPLPASTVRSWLRSSSIRTSKRHRRTLLHRIEQRALRVAHRVWM
jgi:choline dehydrogenase-like flavoprotein